MPVFYHEKLPVYHQALELAVLCDGIAHKLPRDRYDFKNQLWRASTSIPFNLAEGAGGYGTTVRLNYFRIARGSAAECSAIFDYAGRLKLVNLSELPYDLVRDVGAQLGTALFKRP